MEGVFCGAFVGLACVDGTCPNIGCDDTAEITCEECWRNEGCCACMLDGTNECPEVLKKYG